MARFKLFSRSGRPSLGELLGISQASRQVSRRHHLRIVRDPMSPLKNVLIQLTGFLRRLFR